MRILVTGGSGYVGSHVARLLKDQGNEVFVIDKNSDNRKWVNPDIPTWCADIADYIGMDKIFKTYPFDAVVHMAASSEIGPSVTDPLFFYANNVANTALLLNICSRYNVRNVVFSSTSAVYGDIDINSLPYFEDNPKNPITSYGSSKLCCEHMLRDVDRAHGISSVSLRYFNASGADPQARIGEFRETPTHLVPSLAAVALGEKDYFYFNGVDFPTEDGTPIRDFTHVWDIAQAHLNSLIYLKGGGKTTAINIGSGRGSSVQMMYEEFAHQWGEHISFKVGDRRAGDIAANYASIEKAEAVLGWKPKLSTPKKIIEDAIRWYRSDTFKRLKNDK